MENTIVIYYSRTGASRTVAEAVTKKLNCRVAEIYYPGRAEVEYGVAAKQSLFKRICEIECDISGQELEQFERVIFVFPVWAFSLCAPIRSFMLSHKAHIENYDMIATAGGMGLKGCVKAAKKILGNAPKRSTLLRDENIRAGKIDLPEWV